MSDGSLTCVLLKALVLVHVIPYHTGPCYVHSVISFYVLMIYNWLIQLKKIYIADIYQSRRNIAKKPLSNIIVVVTVYSHCFVNICFCAPLDSVIDYQYWRLIASSS